MSEKGHDLALQIPRDDTNKEPIGKALDDRAKTKRITVLGVGCSSQYCFIALNVRESDDS